MTHVQTTDAVADLARARIRAVPDHASPIAGATQLRPATFKAFGLAFEVHVIEPRRFCDGAGGVGQVEWQAFETANRATLFQSWRWLNAWLRTAAASAGEQPVIVVGRHPGGDLAVILPLARVTKLGRPVLTWLGAAHHSFALPIAPARLFEHASAADLEAMIDTIAGIAGTDVVYLTDQPATWMDAGTSHRNRLTELQSIDAPNDSYLLTLAEVFEPQYNSLFSAKSRSQMRRKMRRLTDLGTTTIIAAATLDERLRLLDVFFAQKHDQLAAQGAANVFDRPEIRALYRDLADDMDGHRPVLEVMSLNVGPRIAATVISMRHGDRAYMLNTSFAADPDLSEASPGKLLIHAHVAACHAAGARFYDFGPGEAAYKSDWQATPEPLTTLVRGVNLPGKALAAVLRNGLRLKRRIKRTPALWRAAQTARKAVASRR